MPQFNKKALIVIRAEGITVYLVVLSKCGAFWIQVTFPINTNSPIAETVMFFHSMHRFGCIVGDHALQFADKASEDLHLGNGHEFRFLKRSDMAGDRGEVLIDAGKAVVHREFSSAMLSFKILPSQVCLQAGEFGKGRVHAQTWAWPAQVIAGTRNRSGAKSKLGHHQKRTCI